MPLSVKKQLDSLFDPQSIAFIGASNDESKWGGLTIKRAISSGYRGQIYPVNPREKTVQNIRTYDTILDIPGEVELAVIAVPASMMTAVMGDCVRKGVKAAIVITAGFSETGEPGRALQEEMIQVARSGGIRVMGPNCMGIWSATTRLCLAFEQPPKSGSLAFISQSGTYGGFLMNVAGSKGYGFSRFVSAGNQADLDAADYLEYLNEDQETKAVVMYLEGLTNGRRFLEVAREMIKRKPIVLYKAGRTSAGQSASLSHTGSLSGADEVFDAMCQQAGIIRADEAVHAFDMAEALSKQPLPRGHRVGIVSPGGGFCVTMADRCGMMGINVPPIDEDAQEKIKSGLLPHAPMPVNPIDTGGDARIPVVPGVVEQVAGLDNIDGILSTAPFIWRAKTSPESLRELANAVDTLAGIPQKYGKPLVLSLVPGFGQSLLVADLLRDAGVPVYDTPDDATRAMYALMYYAEVQRKANHQESLASNSSTSEELFPEQTNGQSRSG